MSEECPYCGGNGFNGKTCFKCENGNSFDEDDCDFETGQIENRQPFSSGETFVFDNISNVREGHADEDEVDAYDDFDSLERINDDFLPTITAILGVTRSLFSNLTLDSEEIRRAINELIITTLSDVHEIEMKKENFLDKLDLGLKPRDCKNLNTILETYVKKKYFNSVSEVVFYCLTKGISDLNQDLNIEHNLTENNVEVFESLKEKIENIKTKKFKYKPVSLNRFKNLLDDEDEDEKAIELDCPSCGEKRVVLSGGTLHCRKCDCDNSPDLGSIGSGF